MKKLIALLAGMLALGGSVLGQPSKEPAVAKVLTLGVFHFAFPNLDAVKTSDADKISVLEEPYQSEILAICDAIGQFKPTIIAIELTPDRQPHIDSLYALYRQGNFTLGSQEVYQLGFRIAKKHSVPTIYCVNDWGRPYDNVKAMLHDSLRSAKLESFYSNSPDSVYALATSSAKITSIIGELTMLNDPESIRERLSVYLLTPFKYEEQPGDFAGVDFETGRWYNRNLRIFRNIQRIPHTSNDRILLIIGREHLNLLNLFFDASKEFDLVSPIPYLKEAKVGRQL